MAIPKIDGAQRDFSAGEIDVTMKRADEHPLMKTGARQCANWRILNSRALQNRPGRRALFPETGRVDEVLMSPGNTFFLAFGNGYLRVYNAVGTQVFAATLKGDGVTPIPWTSATAPKLSWALVAGARSVYIAYADGAPANVPQILTWDGVSQSSTWTLTTYAETVVNGQKRTIFYRISPQNITMTVSGYTGNVNISFSAPALVAAHVGTRMRFAGRQLLVTAVTDSQHGTATVEEPIYEGASFFFASDPTVVFQVGDLVESGQTNAEAVITGFFPDQIVVQKIAGGELFPGAFGPLVGPHGSLTPSASSVTTAPQPCGVWDDEVMNPQLRGYPSFVFYDQGRLGFCNFPSVPGAIAWSFLGNTADLYPDDVADGDNAIVELAPGKSQVLYVQAGMEGSEFVFCDNAVHYIPITASNPLKPGSVAFNQLSAQGSAAVQPRPAEQSIIYVKAGGKQIGAVQVPGAYYRPYVVDNISELHAHLFNAPVAIAVPSGSSQFEETYLYVLNANGSLAVGKYLMRNGLIDAGPDGKPHVGWAPWNGAGTVTWVNAFGPDALFTTSYTPNGVPAVSVVEILDNTQYLDGALLVNSLPAPFTPPGGKGPLYVFPGPNSTVTLMDQVTRMMGTYLVDANGNIIPKNNGGENLAAATLTAGQPWTATLEPFVPDASPGQDVHQRMFKRRVSRMAAYVSQSTGFLMARLFAGPLTRTSPALGTTMNFRRIATWNQDDDPTQAPPLREEAQRWRPLGRAFDPRVAIIKDTPGPLIIHEIGIEASI